MVPTPQYEVATENMSETQNIDELAKLANRDPDKLKQNITTMKAAELSDLSTRINTEEATDFTAEIHQAIKERLAALKAEAEQNAEVINTAGNATNEEVPQEEKTTLGNTQEFATGVWKGVSGFMSSAWESTKKFAYGLSDPNTFSRIAFTILATPAWLGMGNFPGIDKLTSYAQRQLGALDLKKAITELGYEGKIIYDGTINPIAWLRYTQEKPGVAVGILLDKFAKTNSALLSSGGTITLDFGQLLDDPTEVSKELESQQQEEKKKELLAKETWTTHGVKSVEFDTSETSLDSQSGVLKVNVKDLTEENEPKLGSEPAALLAAKSILTNAQKIVIGKKAEVIMDWTDTGHRIITLPVIQDVELSKLNTIMKDAPSTFTKMVITKNVDMKDDHVLLKKEGNATILFVEKNDVVLAQISAMKNHSLGTDEKKIFRLESSGFVHETKMSAS